MKPVRILAWTSNFLVTASLAPCLFSMLMEIKSHLTIRPHSRSPSWRSAPAWRPRSASSSPGTSSCPRASTPASSPVASATGTAVSRSLGACVPPKRHHKFTSDSKARQALQRVCRAFFFFIQNYIFLTMPLSASTSTICPSWNALVAILVAITHGFFISLATIAA